MLENLRHAIKERVDGFLDNPNDRAYLAMRCKEISQKFNKNCSMEVKAFLEEFRKASKIDLAALNRLSDMLTNSATLKDELSKVGEDDIPSLIEMINRVIIDTTENRSRFNAEF